MKKKLIGVAVLSIVLFTALWLFLLPGKNEDEILNEDEYLPAIELEISQEVLVTKDTVVVIETLLQRGEGPFNVMERLNIGRHLRQGIINNLSNETDFTALRVGERFAGVFDLDTVKLLEFVYFQNPITTHRVKIIYNEDGSVEGFEYVLLEKPSEIRHRLIRGTLNSATLDAELRLMGLSSNIIGVTSNVLASRVAFRTDARIGDRFSLLLQETFFTDVTENGEPVERTLDERTQILFLSYLGVRAGSYRGYRFFDAPNSSFNAHYTEDGRAMLSSGLRYPLDRIHVTSPFGMRRHPVTGVRTMHFGIDYRARVGTPVFAVAEGRVVKSRFNDINGNYIAIRHLDGTMSYYLHLSRRNVAVGAQVRARQIIGISGATGRVTGPHLCFRIRGANGQWINPANKRMIAAPQLTGEKLEELRLQIARIREIYETQSAILDSRLVEEAKVREEQSGYREEQSGYTDYPGL